jgi:hypothetical protein
VLGGVSYPTMHGDPSTAPRLIASNVFGGFTRNCHVKLDYFVVIQTLP